MKNTWTNNTDMQDAFNVVKVSNPRFKNWDAEDVWYEYTTHPSERVKQIACEELLARHNGMLVLIARKIHGTYPHVMDLPDFIQTAREGAMVAYRRYNPYKQISNGEKASVSTFTYLTVEKYLLSEVDKSTFIKCPAQKRKVRAYVKGKYDDKPEKKAEVEKEYGLDTDEKRDEFKNRFKLLDSSVMSLDEQMNSGDSEDASESFGNILPDDSCDTSDTIINRVDWELNVSGLNNMQKVAYKLFFVDGFSVKEIAAKTELEEKKIRAAINEVRSYFIKKYPEIAAGRVKQNRRQKVAVA